jgi:hypothetical protein
MIGEVAYIGLTWLKSLTSLTSSPFAISVGLCKHVVDMRGVP